MAIYPKFTPYVQYSPNTEPPNVQAWTEQATRSLSAIAISAPGAVRGTSGSLAIPLDERPEPKKATATNQDHHDSTSEPTTRPRREPLRRDSMKRREALLKGKEGSRQRRRWENGL